MTGARRWYIVGFYLTPDNTSTMERFVEALRERPEGAELMVAGDMNINLAEPEGNQREEYIAATLATEGMKDMVAHFLPRRHRWCQDGRMCSMLRKRREVPFWTYYILGTDFRLFGNVSFRDPWHKSDHYMVLGCLPSASLTEHKRYLGGRKKLPLKPPTEPTREDEFFAALRMAI